MSDYIVKHPKLHLGVKLNHIKPGTKITLSDVAAERHLKTGKIVPIEKNEPLVINEDAEAKIIADAEAALKMATKPSNTSK